MSVVLVVVQVLCGIDMVSFRSVEVQLSKVIVWSLWFNAAIDRLMVSLRHALS